MRVDVVVAVIVVVVAMVDSLAVVAVVVVLAGAQVCRSQAIPGLDVPVPVPGVLDLDGSEVSHI